MPVGLVPGLTKSHLEGSVFRYVQETLGLKLMGSYRVSAGDEARGTG
ncbi:putative transcriptional regulator [Klebsiella pneumoniae subsp. rhinoscleromatis]|nr:putative transcriptional regulator [Klebsiella pneumoniae subsp. rhinoscleromatis]